MTLTQRASHSVTTRAARRSLRDIRRRVLAWYADEHRDLPWRATRDPYAVLVSEVMLQQTQASRVVDRFERFLARFPSAQALAEAPEATVLAEWSGLGYNRRALALHAAARAIVAGGWPRRPADLVRLPGVGPYTARALASLAFGEAVGVVDTNVRRWLMRRFGLSASPGVLRLQQLADALAAADPIASETDVAAWTHASMELGARVCRSRAPRCEACPLAVGCPSRGTTRQVIVPRQAPYRGSRRAARGALLRALVAAPDHALPVADALRAVPAGLDAGGTASGLERDGLLHADGRHLRLGSADGDRAPTTIGA